MRREPPAPPCRLVAGGAPVQGQRHPQTRITPTWLPRTLVVGSAAWRPAGAATYRQTGAATYSRGRRRSLRSVASVLSVSLCLPWCAVLVIGPVARYVMSCGSSAGSFGGASSPSGGCSCSAARDRNQGQPSALALVYVDVTRHQISELGFGTILIPAASIVGN